MSTPIGGSESLTLYKIEPIEPIEPKNYKIEQLKYYNEQPQPYYRRYFTSIEAFYKAMAPHYPVLTKLSREELEMVYKL